VVVEILAILFLIYSQQKLHNISGTNAATWQQKLAAVIPSFVSFFKLECCAECIYAELSVIILSVVMLSVFMLSVFMLSVVAPFKGPCQAKMGINLKLI